MNQKLSQAGRKGGMTTGPSKARPLSTDRARQMARERWSKGGVIVKPDPGITQQGPQRDLQGPSDNMGAVL